MQIGSRIGKEKRDVKRRVYLKHDIDSKEVVFGDE
jgi:hypothetical protein